MGDWADDEERRRDCYEGMSKEEYDEMFDEKEPDEPFDMEKFMKTHYEDFDSCKLVRSIREEVLKETIEPMHTAISEIGRKLDEIRKILGYKSPFCEKITENDKITVESGVIKQTRFASVAAEIHPATKIEKKYPRKILIGTPICSDKMYSWKEYVKAVKALKIPEKGMEAHVLVVATNNDGDMEEQIKNEGFMFAMVRGSKAMDRLVHARNYIISYAHQWGYDAVFFIDSDVMVPPNALKQLHSYHKDIVAGFYPITTGLGFPIPHAKLLVKDVYRPLPEDMINDKLQEVDLVGMGCTLIQKSLFGFRFSCERGPYGDLRKSEDMCYSRQIRNEGIPIYFDAGLTCRHKITGNHWDPEKD